MPTSPVTPIKSKTNTTSTTTSNQDSTNQHPSSSSSSSSSIFHQHKPTHKLSRSSSTTQSNSRPNSPIKLTSSSSFRSSSPLIIHRNQKHSNNRPTPTINPSSSTDHNNKQIDIIHKSSTTTPNSSKLQSDSSLQPIKEINSTSTPLLKSSSIPKQSSSSSSDQKENISVCIRLRPLPSSSLSDIDLDTPPPNRFQSTHPTSTSSSSSSDQQSNQFGPWLITPSLSQISLSSSHPIIDKRGTGTSEAINGSEGYEFTLDSIYNPYSSTQDLYEGNVQKNIRSCVRDGYNVTVFAYGQTGSGKTFTMMGSSSSSSGEEEGEEEEEETKGIIPRSIDEVFQVISKEDQNREYLLRVSYLEIYNETLKDLLLDGTPQKLTIHENDKGRVCVNGLREEVVTHPLQVINTLRKGEKARHVGATDWNERSSRSHTVFTMTIESRPRDPEELNQTGMQISQLNLIDLAGSESAASSIERRKEGSFINKSLLSLSNVISKLATSEPHVPYRDSKLTRLLQTSLGGNAKVVVICAVSVNNDSVAETLSTLRFARRAKMVVTKAERGTILDDKTALLQSYQQEIISLKAQLLNNSQALSLSNVGTSNDEVEVEKSKAMSDVAELQLERIRLQEQIEHLNRRILTRHTIQSNVRRSSRSVSSQTPLIEFDSHPARRQRRGRLTDFGGLVGHGGNLGGGMFNVGLRASLLPNSLTVSKEIELEKEIAKLKLANLEKESALESIREGESDREEMKLELERLKEEVRRLGEERLGALKDLEEERKLKEEAVSKYQADLITQTESLSSLSSNAELENLKSELCTAQATILELQQIQDDKTRLEKEVKELETKFNRVEKKYSNERTKAQEIQFELMQITQSRDELETELKERVEELKRFEVELGEVKEVMEKEKEKVMGEEKEEVEKMIGLVKSENKELKDQLDSMKALVEGKDDALMEEKRKLEEELKGLKQLSEEREKTSLEEKNRLEKEVLDLKALVGEKETVMGEEKEQVHVELTELKKSVEEKESARKLLEVEMEELKQTVLKQEDDMVEERKKLKEEEDKVKQEKECFEKELRELKELMEKKEKERIDLEDRVKELKGVVDGKSDVMGEENERLDKEIKELKNLLEESKNEKVKLKEQVEGIESYRSKSEELSSKLSASEHQLRKTRDEMKVNEQIVLKLRKENEEADRIGRLQNREVERLGRELSEVVRMKEEVERKLESKFLQSRSELLTEHGREVSKLEESQGKLIKEIKRLEHSIQSEREGGEDSKQKVLSLEKLVKEQRKEIEGLIEELKRTESSINHRSDRVQNAHHQAEDEIDRLNLIIDEQKRMLSDAKTDMTKWQTHLKAQQAMIAKIQGNPSMTSVVPVPADQSILNLPKHPFSLTRTVSKSSAPPMSTSSSSQSNYQTPLLNNTPLLGSAHQSPSSSLLGSYSNRNSPRPLPVPDSFEERDEEWRRRKCRRKTIEEDMAKLRDENVVERKKNVLMSSSPRNLQHKPKRNLSGLSSRTNRLNGNGNGNGGLGSSMKESTDHLVPPLPTHYKKSLDDRV